MGLKDIAEKNLEEYNDVFADIVNVLLFQGKRVVQEEELESSPARTMYKADDALIHEEERDVSKFWQAGNVRVALWGLENQTQVDAVLKMMSVLTQDERFEMAQKESGGEVKTMCEFLDRIIAEGKAEGKAEGIIETLISLVNDNLISIDEAAKRVNMSREEFEKNLIFEIKQ